MARLSSFSGASKVHQQRLMDGRGWVVNVAAVARSGQVHFEQQEALLFTISVF